MVKNLKRKHINKEYDKNDKEKKVLKKNKKREDELQLEEDDNIISSKTSNISDEKLNEIIKNLKEKGLYYDDLDDFLKNDSMDGVHCSRDDKGQLVMHVKAEKPQDAMDKLHEYGFISEEERDLFKQRFDYLESKGVDVSQIKGGDLNNLRDDKLFEQYEKEMMEKYGPNSPVKGNAPDVQIGNPNEPKVLEPNSEQKDVQDEVEVVNPNESIETDISEGPSDEELLRKFEQVQNEVGLDNKPDVSIGRDREMGD
jgi:hypothetical protein